MNEMKTRRIILSLLSIFIIAIASLSSLGSTHGLAQDGPQPIDEVGSLTAEDTGVNEPLGLVFSPRAGAFYVIDAGQWRSNKTAADFVQLNARDGRRGASRLAAALEDPLNMAFDPRFNRLLVLQPRAAQLLIVPADASGALSPRGLQRVNVRRFGVRQPQGLTVDPASGTLYILDASGPKIVRIAPDADGGFAKNAVTVTDLASSGITAPHGLAFDPSSGHLHVLSPSQQALYELSGGQVIASRGLSQFGLHNPQALTFAPSGDTTDDPSITSLYVADSGSPLNGAAALAGAQPDGQIVEFSLAAPAALPPGTTLLPASLVQVIDTSKAHWNPSAPDPAGLDWWAGQNRLLVVDSEVDEMKIYFQNKNMYLSTTGGDLTGTCVTTSYTHEPTGVGINNSNNHIFISDDAPKDKVYELNIGPDNTLCTGDDSVTTTLVNALYGATDAEDVGYGNNMVFIAGGADAEVFVIPLGANGRLDGGGDDGPMTHFDTKRWGFNDLEGITFNPANGTLFIVSTKGTDRYLGEVTVDGTFLRAWDLSLMGSAGNIRSDVALAPASNGGGDNIYIASRGVDNDSNRNENDGKIWEIHLGSGGGGPSPTPPPGMTPTPTFTTTSTSTPTPTSTPGGDLIFADDFESGSFSAWTASKTDSGDLSVTGAAALQGSKGMQAVLDDTVAIFLTDDTPNAEPRYRARFYFDPNSINMANGDKHFIFNIFQATTAVGRVEFQMASGQYQLRASILNDGGSWQHTAWFPITDAPHPVEIEWHASTAPGANNGGITLFIDGVGMDQLTTVDNDTRSIDRARLGAVTGLDAGTSGTYFFDSFVSQRQNYIGP